MSEWISVKERLPDEGVTVLTKVDDVYGESRKQKLVRFGRLWFLPNKSMYVYYRPTHWKYIEVQP